MDQCVTKPKKKLKNLLIIWYPDQFFLPDKILNLIYEIKKRLNGSLTITIVFLFIYVYMMFIYRFFFSNNSNHQVAAQRSSLIIDVYQLSFVIL